MDGPDKLSRDYSKRNKPIIGLAGGVGAGKTQVSSILESLGAAVIDSDRLGHEELTCREVIQKLRGWWGEAVCPDGQNVDRRAVANIVFEDPAELARLEEYLYPRIAKRRRKIVCDLEAESAVRAIVIDAPKLYEAGVDRICDVVIFVDTAWDVRVERTAASRGWTEEELSRREKRQNPLDKKKAIADHVVVNNSSIDALRSQVEIVFASVLASFS